MLDAGADMVRATSAAIALALSRAPAARAAVRHKLTQSAHTGGWVGGPDSCGSNCSLSSNENGPEGPLSEEMGWGG
jgi:hypothetical protein